MSFFGGLIRGPVGGMMTGGASYLPQMFGGHGHGGGGGGGFWGGQHAQPQGIAPQPGGYGSDAPAPIGDPRTQQQIGGFNANQVPPGFMQAMQNTNPTFGDPRPQVGQMPMRNPAPAPMQPPMQQQPVGDPRPSFNPQMLARGLMR